MTPYPPLVPHHVLVAQACAALGMTQKDLGRHLGVTGRTVTRWMRGGTTLAPFQARILVNLLLPVNRDLASRVAATQGETLPAEVPGAPARRPLDEGAVPLAVDAVVCAAAEALDVSPRAVRPALVAAIRRAREAGVTMEQVEAVLTAGRTPG
jgi:hypothetical protein